MKSQKGITLTSLAIYIVLVFIVLGILGTVTLNFQSGVKEISSEGTEIAEINKFNMYFLQEVKKQGNDIVSINESDSDITFSTGIKYVFDTNQGVINLVELNADGEPNKTIKLAENIEECIFNKSIEEGKTVITVDIKAKNTDRITKEYVLISEEIKFDYEDEEEYTYNNTNIINQTENII
ncbi:MAG: hypothetical protein IJB90_02470 [Clostridia bacterium]|nr:hypothetical protein [Clostridia bacterium]